MRWETRRLGDRSKKQNNYCAGGEPTAKLTELKSTAPSYDRHDRYEFSTPTHQRQQHGLHQQSPQHPPPDRRSTATPSSIHRLRRTPRFSASPISQPDAQQARQPVNRVTVTLGPQGRYVLAGADQQARRDRPKQPRRQLSQGNLSNDSEATSNNPPEPRFEASRSVPDPNRPEPHPALRISKQTHSAILYALEQTLRGPREISEDLVELYSPMSDLMGGRGPATSNGNGALPARPTTARAAVGSPSGIRGPRIIMQERAAREAARERQREEQERERLEKEHAENEMRLLEEAKLREAERKDAERRAAAAAAAGAGTYGAGTVPAGTDPTTSRRPAQPAAPGRTTIDNNARQAGQSRVPTAAQPSQSARHGRTTSDTQGVPGTSSGPRVAGPSGTQPQQQQQPPQLGETSTALGRGRNSFPHAFERWETLSAHWEGLTSFWIRRLEQSAQEISQDPISQQLSRQVTDLSSAGANLFHAVVELQRLRASSERKFQRWFFETRAEIERSQEVTGMLEAALEEERRSRADAIREAVEHEQGTSKMQKQINELRKELTISKEEARRAWEELGRREQEERDRTMSLQLGQPTIVGGVQVVPMTQGVGRGHSQRDPRSYNQTEPAGYAQSHTSPSADRPQYSQAPVVKSTPASRDNNPAFQTPSSVQHQQSYGSEGTYSEGQYNNGIANGAARNPVRDTQEHNPSAHTNPTRTHASQGSDVAAEEFETPATQPAVYQPTGTGSQQQQPQYSAAPDYSGAGYSGPWDDIGSAPRHHHPTRLSDVLEEEEERSRTSASQSQVSRP
ncbi:uncharacterized protein F4817DRAFT_356450 [Daldinia loculata]|uniref:uncharacterized protein n=1 Tax=Daldinia loculata TaxID=103429 RepID=UPI0020C5284E|nr:uncharacterized protein F4817DRAFT_356450 [Daldinia loculata]KAI1651040.1 hypothetical protein F4817DRAFT_356450 [Daldinia loculata]